MDDDAFVASLDDLLAWLLVADSTCWLPGDVISVVFFKVIILGAATAPRNSVHMLSFSGTRVPVDREPHNYQWDAFWVVSTLLTWTRDKVY